jgi:hypothetical protein
MRTFGVWGVLGFGAILLASGCAESRVVGASDEPDAAVPAPVAKLPSTITPRPGEGLGGANPILGDVDGDGFDDFLVEAFREPSSDSVSPSMPSSAYLFYGRPSFPEELSTGGADAVFYAGTAGATAVGDINGDGFADFALQDAATRSFELVLGRAERWLGERFAKTSGAVWQVPELPPPFAAESGGFQALIPVGDVSCDGRDDVVVVVTELAGEGEEDATSTFGLTSRMYVVYGREALPEGEWSASWADARISQDFIADPTPGHAALGFPSGRGDFDGDGCDDLVLSYGDAGTLALLYGAAGGFEPVIAHRHADVTFTNESGRLDAFMFGDADGDGASDVAFVDETERLYVMYGSKQRLLGEQVVSRDLEIARGSSTFSVMIAAGDIDGDASPEIVIADAMYGTDESETGPAPMGAMYIARGIGERRTGRYDLGNDLWKVGEGPSSGAEPNGFFAGGPGLGATLSMAGDVDGDGSSDIVAGSLNAGTAGAVYLFPSTPRAPD